MMTRCMLGFFLCLSGAAGAAPFAVPAIMPASPVELVGCANEPDPGSGTSARHVTRNNCPQDYEQLRQRTNGSSGSDREVGYYDCHRDVRTHRIHGVRIRHRHVGDNCAVREVRSGS